ncbi:MAG: C45 family peptidase [Candidatus Latescibacterota bacterium]|nr:C45 family peptidase [Candidatus Latescibacterota bacterium]
MLRIETRGTPRQRGQQQGEATRDLALPWIERRLDELQQRYQVASQTALLERIRPQLGLWRQEKEKLYPQSAAECAGLAAGLGLDEESYFTLTFYHRLGRHLPQCTVVGSRDAQGRPLLGKTDDIGQQDLGMNICETTWPDTGYAHRHFHFAGTIWTIAGINECGLALGMTGIPGPLRDEGLFSLTALHSILPACADVDEATAHIRALQLNAYGFSLVLGDAQGGLALLEKTSAGMVVLDPATVPLAHTNHILDQEFAEQNPAQHATIHHNGVQRLKTAQTLLASGAQPQEILRSRNPAGAICQRGEGELHTDFAVVFSPMERRMHLWPGYPDEVAMETLDL